MENLALLPKQSKNRRKVNSTYFFQQKLNCLFALCNMCNLCMDDCQFCILFFFSADKVSSTILSIVIHLRLASETSQHIIRGRSAFDNKNLRFEKQSFKILRSKILGRKY